MTKEFHKAIYNRSRLRKVPTEENENYTRNKEISVSQP